jgi:HAD superfamily hydrolase (TIGR01484 family)
MNIKEIKLVATDLDGTFLRNNHSISIGNLKALQMLGEKKIIRVVATGRNIRKVMEVIPDEVPFDFIVYSSGAGILNWPEKKHIYHKNISREASNQLIESEKRITIFTHSMRHLKTTGCGIIVEIRSARSLTDTFPFIIPFPNSCQPTGK